VGVGAGAPIACIHRSLPDPGVGEAGLEYPRAMFPAERILMFTHADSDRQRYREDVDLDEVRERFGLPVDRASI
jgi:hypothetical protein